MQESESISNSIPFTRIIRNVLIFGLVVTLLGEFLFRKRYAEPARTATPEIVAVQEHLRLDSTIGFTWKPNIPASSNILFDSQDAEPYPLSTDAQGFINTPEAINRIDARSTVDIVGLGDSFLEHGATVLTDFFRTHNLDYYNLAMHRQSPPQYTDILETYAKPLKPKWIVYSIFENDFKEIDDYLRWKDSGLDWFTYHSGTWCGTPLPLTTSEQLRDTYLRGYSALYTAVQSRFLGDALSTKGPPPNTPGLIAREINRAYDLAHDEGISFVVLFIPARGSILGGPSLESTAYDAVIPYLNEAEVHYIDLRSVFNDHEDSPSLYYKINGHWSPKGITIAAESILSHMNEHSILSKSETNP
jgi:hypothetical protein